MRMMFISAVFLAVSLFGSGVELKNPDVPLIDLASSVVDSEKGKGGNEEAGLENADVPIQVIEGTEEVEIVVSIRDTQVTINGDVCTGTDRMADRIKKLYKDGMMISLVDDYAEYNTYKEVKKKLTELGYTFKEEANE